MRIIALAAAIILCGISVAAAQTTNKPSGGPFGTDWAKPYPDTGGYIYNDPRVQDRRGTTGQAARPPLCPQGRTYSAASGRCQ